MRLKSYLNIDGSHLLTISQFFGKLHSHDTSSSSSNEFACPVVVLILIIDTDFAESKEQ